jgi:hypothetical protein
MGLFSLFKSKKAGNRLDAERRQFLAQHGRVTDGLIIDTETTGRGEEIVFYRYTLNGVDFESSEMLNEQQMSDLLSYAPGAKVAIRYDPRNQGNSMLV